MELLQLGKIRLTYDIPNQVAIQPYDLKAVRLPLNENEAFDFLAAKIQGWVSIYGVDFDISVYI